MSVNPAVALTIAGSDSGGGAGIQADLKTFAANGVFGCSAITAVTAQNTAAVRAVHPVPPEVVLAQIRAVLDDFPVAAVKTGMLATAPIVEAVAALAADRRLPNLVVDPVLVSSTGARLLDAGAARTYVDRLLPCAAVATPNRLEAEVLLDAEITTVDQQRDAARAIGALGATVVVVKGGHAARDAGSEAVDVVWDAVTATLHELREPRLDTANTHGSGCSFASAIAAGLATGRLPLDAIERAKRYVHTAIAGAAGWRLGAGHGPLDHFGNTLEERQ